MDKMINQVVGANYNNPVLDSRLSVFSVAIPIRVSSDEQAQPDKISLEQQEKDAIDYCHKQEWQVYRKQALVLCETLFSNNLSRIFEFFPLYHRCHQ